ncbi:hypothetical protein H696_02232 [Fonticula alba]|uniref:Uncharacterized protein n=1 Tax=Fonticula alba TaxID=691883 RepID=A0A058ZBH8_FONAL|nr:hypothetical protein H696_02232 [Fonticula alba]KCV71286.1 hypothetical protein H696_02232 [Fonticula alba]|eukprot:XP_009494409.1 hypothetical protein H696_02232 [Fonticula alba]
MTTPPTGPPPPGGEGVSGSAPAAAAPPPAPYYTSIFAASNPLASATSSEDGMALPPGPGAMPESSPFPSVASGGLPPLPAASGIPPGVPLLQSVPRYLPLAPVMAAVPGRFPLPPGHVEALEELPLPPGPPASQNTLITRWTRAAGADDSAPASATPAVPERAPAGDPLDGVYRRLADQGTLPDSVLLGSFLVRGFVIGTRLVSGPEHTGPASRSSPAFGPMGIGSRVRLYSNQSGLSAGRTAPGSASRPSSRSTGGVSSVAGSRGRRSRKSPFPTAGADKRQSEIVYFERILPPGVPRGNVEIGRLAMEHCPFLSRLLWRGLISAEASCVDIGDCPLDRARSLLSTGTDVQLLIEVHLNQAAYGSTSIQHTNLQTSTLADNDRALDAVAYHALFKAVAPRPVAPPPADVLRQLAAEDLLFSNATQADLPAAPEHPTQHDLAVGPSPQPAPGLAPVLDVMSAFGLSLDALTRSGDIVVAIAATVIISISSISSISIIIIISSSSIIFLFFLFFLFFINALTGLELSPGFGLRADPSLRPRVGRSELLRGRTVSWAGVAELC